MFLLRDIPKYEAIQETAERYPDLAPRAAEAYLVLLRVASDILDAIERHIAQHGLSQGRFTVLMLLNCHADEGGQSPSDLATRSGVSRATMTGLIDGLERDGLVARERHADDRRMLTVHLTEAGKAQLDAMLPGYFRFIRELMSGIDEAEQATLVGLLAKLRHHLPDAEPVRLDDSEQGADDDSISKIHAADAAREHS